MPADIAALPLLECHSVPVDQHRLITLLFGIAEEEPTLAETMRSVVWLIGPEGQSEIWRPGKDYPGSSIWFAEPRTGILLGNDFHKPDAVYACKLDGTHIASFTLPLLWDNPIRPWRFEHGRQGIEYLDGAGDWHRIADIAMLISRAKETVGKVAPHLAADWHPRSVLMPANFPGTEEILFRLNRHDGHMRLDYLRSTQQFQET
ncbi:MAG: hypothetical protein ACP5QA_02200 [Phycisphaerae bacterium]